MVATAYSPSSSRSLPLLAYVEASLPGATQRDRLSLAADCGLALEVVNSEKAAAFDPEPYRTYGIRIAAVQAYSMHVVHPLHPDTERRKRAMPHVLETVELAAELGASWAVTVCGFGKQLADRPFDRSLEFFAALVPHARAAGVRVLIEPVSPLRAAAMHDPHTVADLLATIDAPDALALLLDTGHLLDSGLDLEDFFATWSHPVEALHLKGSGSVPPDPRTLIGPWFGDLRPGLISVEHRGPSSPDEVRRTAAAMRDKILVA